VENPRGDSTVGGDERGTPNDECRQLRAVRGVASRPCSFLPG